MAGRKGSAPSREGKRFEDGLTQLEDIVERLEKGDLPLEESLALFERGTGLVRELGGLLKKAGERVQTLARDEDGKPVALPFGGDEE